MKLVSWEKAGKACVGAVVEGHVVDLPRAYRAYLHIRGGPQRGELAALPSEMNGFLEGGLAALEAAAKAIEFARKSGLDQYARPLGKVRLLAPVPTPRKLFCLAGNYREHIEESGTRKVQEKDTVTPRVFMKPPSTTICAPGDPIIITPKAQGIDWEAELAVVIGKKGKYIQAQEAMDYVAGYTCFNDVSERRLKIRERKESEPLDRFFDWLNGKWMDSFAPMGPWLVTRDEIPNPQDLDFSLKVNGQTMQSSNTGRMIFDIGNIIEYISAFVTLEPGDVIATGTPSGVGAARGIFLKPGDVVTIEFEGIGILENPVRAGE